MIRRTAATTALVATLSIAGAGAASASHSHVRHVGEDGACVVVAAEGGEDEVVLPAAVFAHAPTTDAPGGADHPLHVLVHKGTPNDLGAGSDWQLLSSNTCSSFVNAR